MKSIVTPDTHGRRGLRAHAIWTCSLLLLLAWCPVGLAEEPQSCGDELKGKERKQVEVVKVEDAESTDAAIATAEEKVGRALEILFEDRILMEDPRIEKMVKKDSAQRGCQVAVITRIHRQQIGQRPVRRAGATIGEPIFRHDVTVHFGRFSEP